MHTMFNYRFAMFICISIFLIVGCSKRCTFIDVESQRTKLINGIESYQSIGEFKKYLQNNQLKWEKVEGQPSQKGKPPFEISSVVIKNYIHHGVSGELVVTFFNNRLMDTQFYPSDMGTYIDVLMKSEGLEFKAVDKVKIEPFTLVMFTKDYREKEYIKWIDVRLDNEMSLWISRYS